MTFLSNFLAAGRASRNLLILVFIIATAIFGLIGFFIPFLDARSFGMGGGLCVTLITWFMVYSAKSNS